MSTILESDAHAPGLAAHIGARGDTTAASSFTCQVCDGEGCESVADLGRAPLLVTIDEACAPAGTVGRALRIVRCTRCATLQLDRLLDEGERERVATAVGERSFAGRPDLARRFCEDAIDRCDLRGDGHVIEIGSGTGSLLRFFRAWQLPVLGIEPDHRLTRYARLRRIPTWTAHFDATLTQRLRRANVHADLLIISVPIGGVGRLSDVLSAAAATLRPGGVVTMELPDVMRIVGRTRLDEVRHAQPAMPSVEQLGRAVTRKGLELVDVQRGELTDARLRVWIRRPPADAQPAVVNPRVHTRIRAEHAADITSPAALLAFTTRATLVREQIVRLLDDARAQHCTVAVAGAGPGAVTLANVVALARSDVDYVVDHDPVRRGTVLPGTDVPVISVEQATAWRPDVVLELGALSAVPQAWHGVPVYAVADLIDVVHHMTGAPPPGAGDDGTGVRSGDTRFDGRSAAVPGRSNDDRPGGGLGDQASASAVR